MCSEPAARKARNLGASEEVDAAAQSADYKVTRDASHYVNCECHAVLTKHEMISFLLCYFQLSMDLLRNYPAGYNVLPTANPHDVVNITLQMALYHIVDMVTL